MTIRILTIASLAVAVTFGTVTAQEAAAQPFPSRRMTLTVPFPAGSATDGATRRLAESIQNQAGVTVLVENKPVPTAIWQRCPS